MLVNKDTQRSKDQCLGWKDKSVYEEDYITTSSEISYLIQKINSFKKIIFSIKDLHSRHCLERTSTSEDSLYIQGFKYNNIEERKPLNSFSIIIKEAPSKSTQVFMILSIKMPYCKESNKLVGSSNFSAWKKRTNLNLNEDEVMDYIEGSIVQPSKEVYSSPCQVHEGRN